MDQTSTTLIASRHQAVLEGISAAALRSGRQPQEVRLVVVSKSQPVEVLQAAFEAGIRCFGENYAGEALDKMRAINSAEIEWHMIGHVQSRKADLVAGNFSMLHSLDSLKLAARLDHFCAETGKPLPVLLEVNVSGEESKFGFPAWDENTWMGLTASLLPIIQLPNLRCCGLMTMPPYFEDAERTRPYFQKLRRLQELLIKTLPQADWRELSMGTSIDHIAAVEEGATYVRIGQAILGERNSQ